MKTQIVVDSCCDLTPELEESLGAKTVPLTIMLGDESIIDDETLDLPEFMEKMHACTGKIGTAAPSPALYQEAFMGADASYAVTLSSNLSASYANAMLGKELAEGEGADVHVFDSKSAAAGEVLVAMELGKMIDAGCQKPNIIASIEDFIKQMKTYFVLDNIDNLLKSGRLNKIVGRIICLLGIKPLMGSDGDGNIALVGPVRGAAQIVERLAGLVEKTLKDTRDRLMVITHCENPSLAERLREAVEKRYDFRDILVLPTKGISSLYANTGGIVMAY